MNRKLVSLGCAMALTANSFAAFAQQPVPEKGKTEKRDIVISDSYTFRTDGEPGCIFQVEAAAETLAKTVVGSWEPGTRINLERSLKVGDELGGHLVVGHVDGPGRILKIDAIEPDPGEPWGATARFHIRAPQGLERFIATKGSICLDGTSLTINTVEDDVFTVLLIPHSFAVTTWGERKEGDLVHVEVDLMARYAARLAEARPQG